MTIERIHALHFAMLNAAFFVCGLAWGVVIMIWEGSA
jgi:hypothetical protein